MNCPNCNATKFIAIVNPNCKCENGDGGFSYVVEESAELPCWHQLHGKCRKCGYDVGEWNAFVTSQWRNKNEQ